MKKSAFGISFGKIDKDPDGDSELSFACIGGETVGHLNNWVVEDGIAPCSDLAWLIGDKVAACGYSNFTTARAAVKKAWAGLGEVEQLRRMLKQPGGEDLPEMALAHLAGRDDGDAIFDAIA